ncbi:unnamed protein product [Thlaspi arvense]|uniref:Uncharacterized protein n=1 Tax=Thlaspi arvense TaxID=13288 RepID=A0AAU9RBD2_THLAR|nr:unnamed protein product [Thlaspi arvense]
MGRGTTDSGSEQAKLGNKASFYDLAIKTAAWDEDNKILAGRCEVNGGTWCGVSKNGRVAFLVDTALVMNDIKIRGGASELIPIRFLKSTMTPKDYAKEVKNAEKECHNESRAYNLIVADVTSKEMYFIKKPLADKTRVDISKVDFGVHTLSLAGLDGGEDSRLKGLFKEMIDAHKNKQLPPLKELAQRLMYDPEPSFYFETTDIPPNHGNEQRKRYGTTSTTALVVKPTKEVIFYEKHFERPGVWTHHDFTFNITA